MRRALASVALFALFCMAEGRSIVVRSGSSLESAKGDVVLLVH